MTTGTQQPSEAQAPTAQRHACAHNLITMTNEGRPMNAINHELLPDRAVIRFSGELTWESATELADCIDNLTMRYFYKRIELVIHSPGGLAAALEHLNRSISAWRERGVHLRTRVIASAASAAAVLLSMGDERIAEPGARLLYHLSRAIDPGTVTAHASAEIHDELARIDTRIINQLVERALREPDAPRPHQAEPSDRRILKHLVEATAQRHGTSQSRSIRHLTKTLGCAVDAAARSRDRKALTRVYQALADTDRAISAPLARTLRLIDHIGVPDTADARPAGTPGLTVPEWRVLYGPRGDVSREVLTRHTLVLGETGSGKTASVIQPIVAAMARAPRERVGTGLIIDPKQELAPMLGRLAPHRLHHITPEDIVIDVMGAARSRLDADLAAHRWMTAARRILRRISSFLPSSPLNVLKPHQPAHGNAEFFHQEGTRLLTDVLAFILMLTAPATPPPEDWPPERAGLSYNPDPVGSDPVRAWVRDLHAKARASGNRARGPNIIALCLWALEGPLVTVREPSGPNDPDEPPRPRTWFFADLAKHFQLVWASANEEEGEEGAAVLQRIQGCWKPIALNLNVQGQYEGVLGTARTICSEFASPTIARNLYFGCEPSLRGAREATFDFRELVSRRGDGRLVLFQPARDRSDDLLALALKTLFFEAVLSNPEREANDPTMPLVGYVADEFHRFVTSDETHGEQSFLNTCRSFGAFCVLATQSVTSIEHALSLGAGHEMSSQTAVQMLCDNTASKFYFRTTNPDTAAQLSKLYPAQPGYPCLVRARPITRLGQGECYAALADTRFERHQLDRFTFEQKAELTHSAEVVRDTAGARRRDRRRSHHARATAR